MAATVTTANLTTGGATDVKIGGTSVGSTTGPVTLRREVTYIEHFVDQRQGVMKKTVDTVRNYFGFSMAENTLLNLRSALDQAAANLTPTGGTGTIQTLTINETPASTGLEVSIDIQVLGAGGATRTYTFPKAVANGINISHDRRTPFGIPIEFEVIQMAAAPGIWFYIYGA